MATENGNGKTGNGKLRNEKNRQRKMMVGKKGNTKLLSEITKKDHGKNGNLKNGQQKTGYPFHYILNGSEAMLC